MPDRHMLEGKVAIVTGASSGIGLAVAHRLAGRGAKVALVARTREALEKAAREIGGERAAAFALDVKDFAALGALPAKVVARFGALDVVVNNAGLNHRGPVMNHSAQALADVVTTNLTAPVFLTRAALPHIGPGGVIVNVASLAGMVPVPHEAAYCASKAGLRAFTRALSFELEERGVRAAIVSPGPVDTTFFGDVEAVPDIVFSQPMRTADQVADAVIACIEGRADEIALPALSGKLATMGYVFPKLARALRPLLEKRGAANKRAYIAKKRTAVS
jgi:NAD(P)-dependent dehydrogenase (short-subunit alcohol dehydrogenase family)